MNTNLSETLQRMGYSPTVCARLVQGVTEAPESQIEIQRLSEQMSGSGVATPPGEFERTLLSCAAAETGSRIEKLPVYEPVKSLIRAEFQHYTDLRKLESERLKIGTYGFAVACKTISLSRFPSGPMDWEISGFPRSWLLKVGVRRLPRVLGCLAFRVGGFAPLFFIHVARRPKNRALVIEKEVLRCYYRIVRSLELQPWIKGILAHSWFHDPAAVHRYPHLEWINRPYLETKGLIVTDGMAPPDSGFMEHNSERKEQFARGELRLRMGIAVWPRDSALEWANKHPEMAE